MEKNEVIKIFLKVFFIGILLIIIYLLLIMFCGLKNSDKNSLGNSMELQISKFYENIIDEFFICIKNKSYDKAYEMLDEECKRSIFENDVNKFKSKFEEKYSFFNSDTGIFYEKTKDYININKNRVYVINCRCELYLKSGESINKKNDNLVIQAIEYSPFDYKLYLVLE